MARASATAVVGGADTDAAVAAGALFADVSASGAGAASVTASGFGEDVVVVVVRTHDTPVLIPLSRAAAR